ncbi:MAG TPA: trigger factor [Longimicrobiales bacterium]|nr:trigger factor [Longimicrobiales bacterium]
MATEAPEYTVSMEKPAAWSRRLTITIPSHRIEAEKTQAAARLSKKARLPGFRAGRVPKSVMEKRFGPAIEQEAVEKLIGDVYRKVLESEGLQPITQGNIDNVDYQPGSDLTFNVELEVRPEIELERVGGFAVMREQPAIGQAQVDEVLQRLREENAVWRTKEDATPVAGDMATVEITPLDDATSAEPSKPRRYQIVIGEGQAVPAVEDAVRTLKGGEDAEFDVDLPASADDEAAGTKPHRMHIRMVEVKAPEYPELDDEFAKGLGEFEDLATLRDRIREDLEREAGRESERGVRMQLVQQIIDANPFEVPASMVSNYLERVMPTREGTDAERLQQARVEMWPMAEQAIKRSLVVERIAEMEALHATPAEIDARIDDMAERLGRPRGEVIAQLRKSGRLDEIEQEISEEKVFEYLKSLSDIQ